MYQFWVPIIKNLYLVSQKPTISIRYPNFTMVYLMVDILVPAMIFGILFPAILMKINSIFTKDQIHPEDKSSEVNNQ